MLALTVPGHVAWSATPLGSIDQLPLSAGQNIVHAAPVITEVPSIELPGVPARVAAVFASMFPSDPADSSASQNSLAWGDIPGLGTFDVIQGEDLSAQYLAGLARTISLPETGKDDVRIKLQGRPGNLWRTDEYTLRGEPIWMECSFIVTFFATTQGTRVEVHEIGTLLPGRQLISNPRTLKSDWGYDLRDMPYPTRKEPLKLLQLLHKKWSASTALGADKLPWPPRAMPGRNAFRKRLEMLIDTERLRVTDARGALDPSDPSKLRIGCEMVHDDDEPLVFPPGTDLHSALQLLQGIEPVSARAGFDRPWPLLGVAYPIGNNLFVPARTVLKPHERIKLDETISLTIFKLRPGRYRIHLMLFANTRAGRVQYSEQTGSGVTFEIPDKLQQAKPQ
ncbi:hypothetical protein ACS5PN_00110 [Roseateles sp. NT4]|uniref:hypothetical protein n=1 Tax=Roseateles sp. NT4 TaxID=3453715 RepID=UPI003EE87740